MELRGEDLSCYLNNIPSVGLWKCLYDHHLANEAYFSDITMKTFVRVLPTRWRRKPAGIEITSLSPCVYAFSRYLFLAITYICAILTSSAKPEQCHQSVGRSYALGSMHNTPIPTIQLNCSERAEWAIMTQYYIVLIRYVLMYYYLHTWFTLYR